MPDRHVAVVRRQWIAYSAGCWALVFAAFHIAWATGWYIGLDPVEAQAAFAVGWKLAYDLIVAGMCLVAVPVSLALALPWGRRLPQRLLIALAWTGTGLLVLRAMASLVQSAYLVVTGSFSWQDVGVWEPWFYFGATLFTLNLWWYYRRRRESAS